MQFASPLEEVVLLRRYKRFLADVRFPDGTEITVHCPNPGAMMGVAPAGARAFVSRSPNKTRKLPYTLELVECPVPGRPPDEAATTLVGINTMHPNTLAAETLAMGLLPDLPLEGWAREVRYGQENSRIDFFHKGETQGAIYLEVKNCHLLRRPDAVAEFPDCVTARGLKHLRELMGVIAAGHRAVLLFVVQRADAKAVSIAADLDPAYARGLLTAANAGVEILAVQCRLTPEAITPTRPLPFFAPSDSMNG
ncbi:SfsA, sugar fermentation stimulation protein [Parvularcula bermudensis HTCC2503]|uniref:Sugar fermentation stimulation protein homolog n=1 Tax=Parvularcula bermudensis (strain ATCC BAA-594 / HTCC2503 / KCTC 12087) TaxID=314260 RepID=E0TDR2_PARBH|nr:DNA/RNA nuclease SfsA [Parvularcula bermudensis]ADM09978.1 SfsA, sugar fermentation stimulation protein [Parvularcula bermudensis HTCC2503]